MAQKNYPLVRTPQNITVRRTLPAHILQPGEAMPAKFSENPTDDEFYRVHFFEEPLVPISDITSAQGENTSLLYALASYSQRKSPDDFSSLTQFLKDYPKSRWAGSLLANLGIVYRRTGYYNQAMDAWNKSWELLKNNNEPKVKVLADRVVSELLLMNAWVGRADKIDSLLKEIDQRPIQGPAVAQVIAMRSAFWTMENKPGVAYKCGPYALNELFMLKDPAHSFNEKMINIQSPTNGFSLTQLQSMSADVSLNYQMAYRQAGSAIINNSVVHWKLGHFSALLVNDSGSIRCQDGTAGTKYGEEFWVTKAALDSSASGYFLVPKGSLPPGWRTVTQSEGSKVFGKGFQVADPGKHVSTCDPKSDCKTCQANGTEGQGMAQSDVHLGAVSLHIFDDPIFYSPPIGPKIDFTLDYHRRDTYQPANFNYSSFGPKWTFKWLSFVQDNPSNPYVNPNVYMMEGGVRTFTGYNPTTKSYAPEMQTGDVLVRVCDNCYELRHSDGSKEVYSRPDGNTSNGRKIFLTEIDDVTGNKVQLFYDSLLRITALQDAIGQATTLSYENAANKYEITTVTDPFGRRASFDYDTDGQLTAITDMIGIISSFHYSSGEFIDRMTTPYGTTSFIEQDGNNDYLLETHFPMGEKERVEYRQQAPGISLADTVAPSNGYNTYLYYRNTFFWDKKAMLEAPGDYTKAKIYHWLHGSGAISEGGYASPVLESVKEPLENRVWYSYQGQGGGSNSIFAVQGMVGSGPSITGRVLDDGSSQFTKNTYNSIGNVTNTTDPLGRSLTYVYDSTQINLMEVRQTTKGANELLGQYTYNDKHQPLTSKDASGQLTIFTYNPKGQITTVTNARHETTTFKYDSDNYLTSIVGPIPGSTVSFTYDGFGRVRTITDQEGYTTTTDYDALNRPTLITYPDSSYEQIVYDRLDAVRRRDRLGRWDSTGYDSLDRPTAIEDALGRVTQLIWCNCGSLAQIIDPLNHTTTFTRDLQGRLVQKTYHDGKSVNYQYEKTTSRLKEVTDAKGQKTDYRYNIDNNPDSVIYNNAFVATPTVSFKYDPSYNRVVSITDGTGTTLYNYNPVLSTPTLGAGKLASIDGPLANDLISYTYDSLGRQNGRSINGVASSVIYDVLGRITETDNALGKFTYSYVNQTERLSSITMPNHLSTVFSYYDNKGDQRLKEIWNKSVYGNTLSKFDYEYNVQSQIIKWTQQASGNPPKAYEYVYDNADQLIAVNQKSANSPISIQQYAYRYDSAGNRFMENAKSHVSYASYNSLNQLISQESESLKFHNPLPVQPVNSPINTITYDDNGNTISETSPAVTYGWDAADRLISITKGTDVSEFVYDGLSRRVAEKLNGVVIKRWLWDGTEMAEERDVTGATVAKRFFSQGEQINGINYYFTRDHLGSVREMTDSNGIMVARYDYDPYGRRIKLFGNLDADFGFTGHYYHSITRLYLTMYRAYDADLGRWISRDPINEIGGLNLYSYVSGNSINLFDPVGLSESNCGKNKCEGNEEDLDGEAAKNAADAAENAAHYAHENAGKTRFGLNYELYFEKANGKVFTGNGSVSTFSLGEFGHSVSRLFKLLGYAMDAIELVNAFVTDKESIGCNTKKALGGTAGSIIGGWSGFIAGSEIGAAYGAVGGPLGILIGGLGGGLFGSWYIGSKGKEIGQELGGRW